MNTVQKTTRNLMLAVAFLLSAIPAAAANVDGFGGQVIKLVPTKYGLQVNATGLAKIAEPQKGVETFGVVIFAEVKDGKFYSVEVTTADKGVYKVADLDMNIGVGSVKQSNLTHQTRAFPIAELISITVRDRGGVLLTGSFWY